MVLSSFFISLLFSQETKALPIKERKAAKNVAEHVVENESEAAKKMAKQSLHLSCRSKCDEKGLFAHEEEKLSQKDKQGSSSAQLSRQVTMSAMSIQEAKKCQQNTSLRKAWSWGRWHSTKTVESSTSSPLTWLLPPVPSANASSSPSSSSKSEIPEISLSSAHKELQPQLSAKSLPPTMAGLRYSSSTMMSCKHLARAQAETTCWSTRSPSYKLHKSAVRDAEARAVKCRGAKCRTISCKLPRSTTSCRAQTLAVKVKHEVQNLSTSCKVQTLTVESSNTYCRGQPRAVEAKHEVQNLNTRCRGRA
ncbi:hypothetical protein SLEP1_g58020 [Rubroshorea leprosula]|uniref:Uncharacterized protein n=1 Tax=Rubroshorea leprosula TaxID=152421 RepID=A0AAV5MMZ2_9ROSI|nr:hypothetical protein SLEP1_g58020 [Rubroshorea leprosula]